MYHLANENFSVSFNTEGRITDLVIKHDPTQMNWVINEKYLKEHGYKDDDKLFGNFKIKINGIVYENTNHAPEITLEQNNLSVSYKFQDFSLIFLYSTKNKQSFVWKITLINNSHSTLDIENFMLWFSPSYIMYRDMNVRKNMDHSCAIFPHLSDDYTKIANIKRNNKGPNLGIYNTKGKTISIGSFCRYQNRFREQVSPSLDGAIFHHFILAGQEAFKDVQHHDWVYSHLYKEKTILEPGKVSNWEYTFLPFQTRQEFLLNGLSITHPIIDYSPVIIKDGIFEADIKLSYSQSIKGAYMVSENSLGDLEKQDVLKELRKHSNKHFSIRLKVTEPGKKKFVIKTDQEKKDFVVFNVMEPINDILKSRIDYLCKQSFIDNEQDKNAYGFKPISNQGESLGKLSFILTNNLISGENSKQIQMVEKSAVFYIKNKWFVNGDFNQPKKIHGEFYRIMDFDYIAHIYYLLSQFEASDLQLNLPKTYLKWAAQILIMRFNEEAHEEERAKRESRMNGVFNIYIKELLHALKINGLNQAYQSLSSLVEKFFARLKQTDDYTAAITEHYYDNAGFGPTTESLCISGHIKEAKKYGELILANIGFSNDFRNQNPDRWWEALSFMIHSLWGGLVSYSALVAYEHFHEIEYLQAAYRSMMAVLYCYDWHETSGLTKIDQGMAASTYSVSSPNLNDPSLSRNRFGQSVFLKEDEELFKGNATGDDWDMGQELVAYLNGFGTKTYLYIDNGELKCINGYIEVQGQEYIVHSFAAYPKTYILNDLNLMIECNNDEMMPKLVLRMDHTGQLKCVRKEIKKLFPQ